MKKNKPRKITWFTQFAYGSGNLLGSGALAISGAWLLYFYTTFCGLSVVEATLIFSVATYLDVILNPIMGFVTDGFYQTKLGKKFGRRRFFILIGIPLMLVYPLLWVNNMNFWYYLTTYIVFEIIYNSVMIPYDTLATEMTKDFSKRTYLTGAKAMFGKIANFLAAAIPGMFIGVLGKDSPLPFFYTGLVYGLIMMVALILLYFNSWERSYEEVEVERVGNFWRSIKKLFVDILSTLRIRTFRHHMGMYLFGFGAEWLFAAVFTYFVVFVLQRPATFVSGMNSLSSILQLISTAVFIAICVKKGFTKPFTWALSIVVVAVILYSAVYFLNIQNLTPLIIGITIVFGLGTGGVYYIPWSVYTFMADVDEVVTNRRREGVYAGAMTMAGKLVRASVIAIMGLILAQSGFESGAQVQPPSAVHAILGVLIIGVVGLALIGIYFSNKMKLTPETHKIILAEIDRIHNGGKMEDVNQKTKEVIEQLTGFPYEKCFGNNNVGYQEKGNRKQDVQEKIG
ncbi:MFS transporter [Ectobacillus funiculus]|uniref:MFS transporter n=1 Tax=Ectobacillus funiculus TaxID=137993 RepID=UPI00397D87D0